MRNLVWMAVLAAGAVGVGAQTRVNLKGQASNADLSQMGATSPMQTGPALPAQCAVGQMYFLTGTGAHVCVSANSWMLLGAGGGGAGLPSATKAGQVLTADSGLAPAWSETTAGSGLAKTVNGAVVTWSADSTVLPFLALDNAFLGNNAFAGKVTTTRGSVQTLTPVSAIDVSTVAVRPLSAASATTLTSTPTIAVGDDGQQVFLENAGSSAITLQDRTRLAGSNLCLTGGANLTLAAAAMAHLVYSSAAACWIQVGGSGSGGPANTDALAEGSTNLYFTTARARSSFSAGSGVSISNGVISATGGASGGLVRDFPAAVCQSAAGSLAWNTLSDSSPVPDCVIGAHGVAYGVAKFSNSTAQAMQQSLDLPDAVSSVTFEFAWRAAAAAGAVVWQVRYFVAAVDGTAADDPDVAGSGTVAAAPAVTAATGVLKRSTVTVNPASAGGKRLYFTVFRDPAATGDTFSDATYMPELAKVTVKVQ